MAHAPAIVKKIQLLCLYTQHHTTGDMQVAKHAARSSTNVMVARLLVVFKDTVHSDNIKDTVRISDNKRYILYIN